MKYIVKWSSSNNNGEFTISTNSNKELIEAKLKVERELGESVTILSCKKDSLIKMGYIGTDCPEIYYAPYPQDYNTFIDYSGGDCGH